MSPHYEESRFVPFTWALYAGAVVQLVLVWWIPEGAWVLGGVAVLLAALGWVASRYEVRFDGDALHFGFRQWSKTLRLGEILGAREERVGLWTFGGAGWRLGKGKIGYVRWFGPAIAVKTPQREYWLSAERPADLLRALGAAGVPIEPNV